MNARAVGLLFALAFAGSLPAPAAAQDDMADHQRMQSAMLKAQAEAVKPGDEQLDCAGLEKEMIASVSAPGLREQLAKMGARAERDQAAMKAGAAQIGIQTALTLYATLVPGGAWAQVAAAQSQAPVQQARTADRVAEIRSEGMAMMQFLPQILRGQRVIELAQQRGCDWLPAEAMAGEGNDTSPPVSPR